MKTDQLIIGKILNTHGIKGTIKVQPITSDINRFESLNYIILDDLKIEISNRRISNNLVYLDLKGYDDINKVLSFKGKYIYILEDDRIDLKEGEYFQYQVIGLKCYDTENNFLGTVKSILENPVHEILEIEDETKAVHYVPFIDNFIVSVDLENGIILNPIEGMF
ncbi:ribosome maturation factor RimM [uncultured Peptoniphilus sp.]|uniref:ribosome maturation factor RimM n=1 Tax=uncultured Peptoniphilus sp. TaxID=254354 RepID=UPI0028042550|nr:ribosome maturation factor RimM [uncultured Peptoniphilus sp.]